MSLKQYFICSLAVFALFGFESVNSHGRLLRPTGRSTLWRFDEFKEYNPPINYNDNELFCGGKDKQHDENGGRCGECGDDWALPKPRAHENGGYYGRGIIASNYTRGQNITVEVELTAPHLGHFEFKICSLGNSTELETQECFDKIRLPILQDNGVDFNYTYYIDNELGYIVNTVALPPDFTCERCSFLWYYQTGNSWGDCDDGSSGIGCGPQEEFRGCADISIFP